VRWHNTIILPDREINACKVCEHSWEFQYPQEVHGLVMAYVETMHSRLEDILATAGTALVHVQSHGWSKNLGKRDRDKLDEIARELRYIISYATVIKGGE
jgi:hypothetical protein